VAPSAALPPLRTEPPIVPLEIEGFNAAVISIPLAATSPKPIVIATHGLWDPPEGLCDNWRWIMRDRAWVLCPRGKTMPDKTWRYESSQKLLDEIDAGVRALSARFPGYVDDRAMMYTGFSHGAIVGVGVVAREPARFPYAIFTEGGEDLWTLDRVRKYQKGGGKRVLFACGLRGRVPGAESIAKMNGVPAHVVLGKLPDSGQFVHWYNGPVADEERKQLDWMFEGDERWGHDTH
jgi:hypothetical protein